MGPPHEPAIAPSSAAFVTEVPAITAPPRFSCQTPSEAWLRLTRPSFQEYPGDGQGLPAPRSQYGLPSRHGMMSTVHCIWHTMS
eukprot:1592948-Lingulodinium_polyedra.AAC.1